MIAFNAAAQVVSLGGMLLVQTAFLIITARILGVEDFGRFSYIFGISQIVLIGGDLGLHNTAIRKISFRRDKSPQIFSLFFSLKLLLAGLLTAGVALLAFLLRDNVEARGTLFLFGVGLFFHSANLSLNIGFQAHGKLYFASLSGFLLVLINAVAGVAGLLAGGGLIWLGWAYLIACLMTLAGNWALFGRRIHAIRLSAPRGGKAFLSESFPVGLGTLFDAVAGRVALILLASLAGNFAAGIFSAPARVTGALRNAPAAVFSAVLPALALHRDRPRQARAMMGRYVAVIVPTAALVAAGLYLGSEPLIVLLYGESYLQSAVVLRILALCLVPLSATTAFNSLLVSQPSLFRRLPWVSGVALLVHVICNLVLIPHFGPKGAALSVLAGETAAAVCGGLAVWSFLGRSRP